tara:strand:+ start:31 stop:573 length:543 start_codon:yes stop_codon:yes gene_type:complete
MNTSDITRTIFIFWMFTMLHVFSKLSTEISRVKNNWVEYRCKPSIMLFANVFGHDAYDNFTYCIQHIQSAFIENSLQDINKTNSLNNDSMKATNMSIGNAHDANDSTHKKAQKSTGFTMGIFSNVIIGVKRFFSNMKDIMHRAEAAGHLETGTVSSGGSTFGSIGNSLIKKVADFPFSTF